MPSPGDDFLHRLLAAHGAEDAFDHDPEDDDGVGDPPREAPPSRTAAEHFDSFGAAGIAEFAQVHRFPQAAAAA